MALSQNEKDSDLIVVAVAEEYGRRHQMAMSDVTALFAREGLFDLLRSQYDVLHTLDLDEGADFIDQYLEGSARG